MSEKVVQVTIRFEGPRCKWTEGDGQCPMACEVPGEQEGDLELYCVLFRQQLEDHGEFHLDTARRCEQCLALGA